MVEPISGISEVVNESPITGGTEEEDDDSLRGRIEIRDLSEVSSYVGNPSDYKRWALEVTGVGSVVVIPEWMGKGSGTVKLIIMDSNGAPANPTILSDVYNHIMSPDNEDDRLAPIGTILTVDTAMLLTVDISASVQLEPDADIDLVRSNFAATFTNYWEEAYKEHWIRITRVGSMLSETPGVVDYTNLRINEGTANISITDGDYPYLGTITLAVIS